MVKKLSHINVIRETWRRKGSQLRVEVDNGDVVLRGCVRFLPKSRSAQDRDSWVVSGWERGGLVRRERCVGALCDDPYEAVSKLGSLLCEALCS